MIPAAIVSQAGGVAVSVGIDVGEGLIVGVAVFLGCVGEDIIELSLVGVEVIAFELCAGCASMLAGRQAISNRMLRSGYHKAGWIDSPI